MLSKSIRTEKKPSAPLKPRWAPHAYQKKAVKWLLTHGAAALFLDPGLGKTSVTLAAIKMLKKSGVMSAALIVAPLRPARTVWPKEAEKWADFEGLSVALLHGPNKLARLQEDHDVYVINYEGLPWLIEMVRVGKLNKPQLTAAGKLLLSKVDTLVWDELSKMKHTNTVRYKTVKPFICKFARRWGLTGSPASNGLLDLFGQCYVLDEGNALGQFITHYRAEFFLPVDKMGYVWKPQEGAEAAIHARLKPLALSMQAEDYLELPEFMPHTLKFDMDAKTREHYEELEEFLLTVVEETTIVSANGAAAANMCRQICSGAVYEPHLDPITGEPLPGRSRTNRAWKEFHTDKLDLLEDLVEELQGHQLFVAYEFRHDLERLLKRFPNTPYIGGGVSGADGERIEQRWNQGEIPLLFGQPASVGHGLNLQESSAHHIVWFTLTWDFELYDQFNRRLRRQGNKAKHVHVYHIVARDSVEESVMWSLRQKEKTQKTLVTALRTKRRCD